MSITQNFPAIRPTLNLDFVNSLTVDPRITFTRASTATYYDGKTFAKAEENLLVRSQEFDNAAWVKSGATVTANTGAAPDGTTTADTLTASAANGSALQTFTAMAQPYTFSLWVRRTVGTGTVEITADGTTWSAITISGTWTRFSVTVTPSAGSRTAGIRLATSGDAVEIWGAQLEQRPTATAYTPTTDQPITRYVPQLMTAAANTPRIDFDPVTGACRGLLIEEQRTNLLLRSEEFENAAWGKAEATVTPNVGIAPNGTLTADLLTPNATNAVHGVQIFGIVAVSTTYTASVFAKAAGETTLIFANDGSGTATFNLSTGVASLSGLASATVSMQSVGNGWWRCIVTFTSGAGSFGNFALRLRMNGAYLGDGASGVLLWGAQLEAGAFPTSYIPTTSSQATRSADSAVMTGTNFSSWYRQDEGTLYGDATIYATTANGPVLFGISDGTTNNAFYGGQTIPSHVRPLGVRANAADQAFSFVSLTVPVNYSYKFAGAYRTNSIGSAVNGTAAAEDTTALIPQVNQAAIGGLTATIQRFSGHIRRIAYYPARLPDAQLQALTA